VKERAVVGESYLKEFEFTNYAFAALIFALTATPMPEGEFPQQDRILPLQYLSILNGKRSGKRKEGLGW